MSNKRNTKTTARTADEELLCLFVETLSQQNRDLETGTKMFLKKQGPPEERERLVERAKKARVMFQKMKQSMKETQTSAAR